jgi:hypothetical protein
VADVNSIPFLRDKNKLVIVDALKVQCNGGPAYYPDWALPFGGILMGDDPVAVDVVALQILEKLRAGFGLPPLKQDNRYPAYIHIAADANHRLGLATDEKINVKEIIMNAKGT